MGPYTISFLILFALSVLIVWWVLRWLVPVLQRLLQDLVGASAITEYYRRVFVVGGCPHGAGSGGRSRFQGYGSSDRARLGSHTRPKERIREPDARDAGVSGSSHDRGGGIETPIMSNGTYLAVSYVGLGVLALLMMVFVYLVLRDSYAQIADAMTPNARGQFLKRAFPVVLTLITGTGFFSVSYNYKGCTIFTYEQVMKDRGYLVKTNREQLKETAASLATGVLCCGSCGDGLCGHNPQAAPLAANARDPHLPARDSIFRAVGKQQAGVGRRAQGGSGDVLAG
jgi:hypothetical protein